MSRYRGIALTALVLTLSACTESSGETHAQPSTTVLTTTTSTAVVTVAHPKRVDDNTKCQDLVTAAEVGAATGATAKLAEGASAPALCIYGLMKADGSDVGVLNIYRFVDITTSPTAVNTTLGGNTAVEQRESVIACTFFVVLDGNKRLNDKGAALSVTAELRNDVDACQAARQLVEKAFARLPDA